jgi:hypothetical protein
VAFDDHVTILPLSKTGLTGRFRDLGQPEYVGETVGRRDHSRRLYGAHPVRNVAEHRDRDAMLRGVEGFGGEPGFGA